VTFAHLKLGHMTGSGAAKCGPVHVVDIGVPSTFRTDAEAHLVEAADVRAVLGRRAVDTHKYRAGHVAILAGSPGKTGAALLAAQGALRAGAGAATVVSAAHASLESKIPEVMVQPLTDFERVLERKKVCLIGPGFGTDAASKKVSTKVLASFADTVVADADMFTLHKPADFAKAKGKCILTPHSGELGRLLGRENIDDDRFAAASEAAKKTKSVVLLKGAYTIVADPTGRAVVIGSGTPALATAGSGDVLAGIVAAMSCTLPPFEAAWTGAFLHGIAGTAWAKEHGDRGLLASEIAAQLPGVLGALLTSA
jgi:NAD(P)H-hydrate epimerase